MSVFRINKSPDEERSDKGLRDKLNAHSVKPPSYIWDNVEENLPQERKRRGFIFWLLPLAACLAGLVALLYIGSPKNALQIAQHQQTESISTTKNESKSQANKEQHSIASTNSDNIQSTDKQENAILSSKNNEQQLAGNEEHAKTENLASISNSLNSNKTKNNSKAFSGNTIYANSKSYRKQDHAKNSTGNFSGTEKNSIKLNTEKDQPLKDVNTNANKPGFATTKTEITNNEKPVINNTEATNQATDSTVKNIAENKILEPEKKPETSVELSTDLPKARKHWAIGLESGIGYAYRFIPAENSFMEMDAMTDTSPGRQTIYSNSNYNEVESAASSWKNGLNIQYRLNDKWFLHSGISYTKANIRSKINAEITYEQNSSIGNEVDTFYTQKNSTGEFSYDKLYSNNAGYVNSLEQLSITQQNSVKYTFSFIDISLQLQYRTSATKVAWFIQGGPSAHFLVGKKAVYTVNDQNNNTQLEKTYNAFAISADLYSGISVPLKKFDLQLGPAFNYWLTPLMPALPSTHLYTTQLKGAIYYRF